MSSTLKVRLLPRAESAVRTGHPWVFAESIKEQNREGEVGELVVMYDRRDRFLAVGLFDPESPIRIRVIHQGSPATVDRDWWAERAMEAKNRRASLFNATTDGGRWINGENESFPGLVADRYGNTLVVKLYSAVWMPMWKMIESVLREVFQPEYLVLRISRNLEETANAWNLSEGFRGEVGPEVVIFSENGIRFEAAVLRGQKTGFFLDQRDNRARVEELASGRDVLNLFSFSGGFSLFAARGGANQVTDVDISNYALESARRNFGLNPPLDKVAYNGIQADVFEWVDKLEPSYDLVIVDPPSLAKRESDRRGAIAAYRRLNTSAMNALRPGGIIVAASCSAHVSKAEFLSTVRSAAMGTERTVKELWSSGHAIDHPISFPEADYLKAIALQFED